MQFGFMKGKGTTYAVILWGVQEKFIAERVAFHAQSSISLRLLEELTQTVNCEFSHVMSHIAVRPISATPYTIIWWYVASLWTQVVS